MSYLSTAVAIAAHQSIGQKRKYGGLDYYTHPLRVAEILSENDDHLLDMGNSKDETFSDISMETFDSMLEAAELHDVIEDTNLTLEDLKNIGFCDLTISMVDALTDPYKDPKFGNRAERNRLNTAHTKVISTYSKAIKCCDVIHNISTLPFIEDQKFAKLYISEKKRLVEEALDPELDDYACELHILLYSIVSKEIDKTMKELSML